MSLVSKTFLIGFLTIILSQIYVVLSSCEHKSIQELIKTSPVIIKALGAKIFADNIEYLGREKPTESVPTSKTTDNVSSSSLPSTVSSTAFLSPNSASSLITLTPETIYKGASILKVSKASQSGEYFEYEGQLNASLESLECFDNSILNLLPAELIAFGKVDSSYHPDLLRVSISGLHRWSTQFERRIWKYLGWDDWSDFTQCSVTCGKGVQQRFRRCLLDSPDGTASIMPSSADGAIKQQERQQPSVFSLEEYVDSTNSTFSPIQLQSLSQGHHHHHHHHRVSSMQDTASVHGGLSSGESNKRNQKKCSNVESSKAKKRRKKKGKGLSTLSCEGYNIEQRNCNMFECRDDISDLLKFHQKIFTMNEESPLVGTSPAITLMSMPSATEIMNGSSSSGAGVLTSPILLHGWKNPMNFTLMTTLRVKKRSQSTIFSLRNATHNLYLDQSLDGLKFFEERYDSTEMLPIKLNLYDNQWHQISISVHNGDFITIYVDCVWINSFIVSKGLYTLPESADIVVNRENDFDIQQLIIIPGNHERLQCSSIRTSINEVKRYIIDTFIDDDGN